KSTKSINKVIVSSGDANRLPRAGRFSCNLRERNRRLRLHSRKNLVLLASSLCGTSPPASPQSTKLIAEWGGREKRQRSCAPYDRQCPLRSPRQEVRARGRENPSIGTLCAPCRRKMRERLPARRFPFPPGPADICCAQQTESLLETRSS